MVHVFSLDPTVLRRPAATMRPARHDARERRDLALTIDHEPTTTLIMKNVSPSGRVKIVASRGVFGNLARQEKPDTGGILLL